MISQTRIIAYGVAAVAFLILAANTFYIVDQRKQACGDTEHTRGNGVQADRPRG